MITSQRERRVVVVEGAIRPEHGVVADLAGGRESGGNVVHRRGRVVVIGLMARYAGGVGQLVIVVDVALRALRAGQVEASQRPTRGRVIKLAIRPQNRVVTQFASCREAGRDVIHRRGGGVVVSLVATHANRVGAGQVVIVVDMALRALRAGQVESGQRPARGRVIELAVAPQNRVVTPLTG